MNRFSLSVVLIMAFSASGCLKFGSVTQPDTAESLETIQVPITINIYGQASNGGRTIIDINGTVLAAGDTIYNGGSGGPQAHTPLLAIKLPNNWSVMDSIEFTGDYTETLVPDPTVSTLFEAERPSGPDYTWWGGSTRAGFAPVAGTSVSGTANIIINDTTGTFSIDYYVVGQEGTGSVGDRETSIVDSSVAHSITVSGITTAVQETTWGVLKSRR